MKTFITEIWALDYKTGKFELWSGPEIEAPDMDGAQTFCDENGFGYCKVIGEKLSENEISYN